MDGQGGQDEFVNAVIRHKALADKIRKYHNSVFNHRGTEERPCGPATG
jgi:hypothetical protein